MKKRATISVIVSPKEDQIIPLKNAVAPLKVASKKSLTVKEKELVRLAANFIVNKIVATTHEKSH